ncbi:MAG TPA: UDP-N-acetylmuramate dehydrogenase [Candidatus Saccharimonadales bacterium]|nr:UDP-N-acetylmuramate dehydrogenase [Candidatus Saccharimonadales bacterium]
MMNILENVSLAEHSTMRLGGPARYFATANSEEELVELTSWAQQNSVKFLVVGGGSNIIWRDEGYDGLVIVIKIKGRQVLAEDEQSVTVRLGAGEVWDEAVAWSVDQNLSGIEFLSAIPGSAGAGPVQNIGAYGAEIADSLVEVAVYDKEAKAFGSIAAANCGFGYRTSRFKTTDKGRFFITSLVLRLKKENPKPPFYESLQNYLTSQTITEYTPKTIRQAVIAIRAIKLPDPSVVNNNGSFFTNPIIDQPAFDSLKQKFPDIKGWPAGEDRIKVSAGWLVEQAGFKGYHDGETGMATWDQSALVMINERAKSTADLLKFKQKIVDKVQEMFGITLEQEPELLP